MDGQMDSASKKNIVLPKPVVTIVLVAVSVLLIGGAVLLVRSLDDKEYMADASLASQIARIGVFSDQSAATATPAESGPEEASISVGEGFDRAARDHWAVMSLLETPGLVAESPRSPSEMQPFSLGSGDEATVRFGCGGEEVNYWTETVEVVSIEKVEGDLLEYKARVKIGDSIHEVDRETYRIDDGYNARVYFLGVMEDRVIMFLVRNAC